MWQAAPTWSTLTSTVSASQSSATDLTCWTWPEVSPFDPVLLAAARPVGAAAGGERAVQRLVVHPAEHQHLAGVVLLGDGGDEAVGAALEAGGDLGVEAAGAGGRAGHACHCAARERACRRPCPLGGTAAASRTLAGMSTHAKRERLLLADLLEAAGPTPRPCARAGRPAISPPMWWCASAVPTPRAGSLIKQLAARLDRVQTEFAEKPYEELIQLIRTGPPRFSPFSLKQVDEASNTVEFYVHAEDVRRAQPDWTPRELDPVFAGRPVVAAGEAPPG